MHHRVFAAPNRSAGRRPALPIDAVCDRALYGTSSQIERSWHDRWHQRSKPTHPSPHSISHHHNHPIPCRRCQPSALHRPTPRSPPISTIRPRPPTTFVPILSRFVSRRGRHLALPEHCTYTRRPSNSLSPARPLVAASPAYGVTCLSRQLDNQTLTLLALRPHNCQNGRPAANKRGRQPTLFDRFAPAPEAASSSSFRLLNTPKSSQSGARCRAQIET